MPKTPASFSYYCDHPYCNATVTAVRADHLDEIAKTFDWMVVYPEEPNDECDCKCYCPKHKHISVIPENAQVIGRPISIIMSSDRFLETVSIPDMLRTLIRDLRDRLARHDGCSRFGTTEMTLLSKTDAIIAQDDTRSTVVIEPYKVMEAEAFLTAYDRGEVLSHFPDLMKLTKSLAHTVLRMDEWLGIKERNHG